FTVDERPSEQHGEIPDRTAGTAALDLDHRGLELWAGRDWRWSGSTLSLAGRALREEVEPRTGSSRNRTLASLSTSWRTLRRWGDWSLSPDFSLRTESGRTADEAGGAGEAPPGSRSITTTPASPFPGAGIPPRTSAIPSTSTGWAEYRAACCRRQPSPGGSPCPRSPS